VTAIVQTLQARASESAAEARRDGIGLCLSGGGFRASLFHLGALRRLHELGILGRVRTISSVSGGSIMAGFLADRLAHAAKPLATAFSDWDREIARPFRAFCSRDLRTVPVLTHILWNWINPGPRVRQMEGRYHDRLTKLSLGNLPATPHFVFCATDLTFGVNFEFTADRTGDYQAGYLDADAWPLARAVAASASFPPIFGPVRLGAAAKAYRDGRYRGPDRERLVARLELSDGGVYDNMGIEPVWKDHECVLVSDCGAPFDFSVGSTPWWRLLRYTGVVTNQTRALRLRQLFADWNAKRYAGTYWSLPSGLDDAPAATPPRFEGYSLDLAHHVLATIRTDLDNFNDAEMSVLENHGYFLADRKIRRYAPQLLGQNPPAARTPYPEWQDEQKVRAALRSSGKRLSLSRFWAAVKRGL